MNMAKDPICGMMVDEKKAKFKSDYNGKTFYFCAASCKTTFDKNPAKYAGAAGTPGVHSCGCGGH
jgi:YHS domain-containing protein